MTTDEDRRQQQARYDARWVAVREAIAALPPAGQEFVGKWRRPIEMCGRHGANGCSLSLLEEFVAGVQGLLVAAQPVVVAPVPEKVAEEYQAGSGH